MASDSITLINNAIDWIQANALARGTIDWKRVRELARERAAREDAYTVIEEVLRALGDGHSALRLRSREQDLAEPAPSRLPRATQVADGIGMLELPAVSTHGDAALPYPRAAHLAMRAVGHLPRWIVDLRSNTGGNMWPMLLAAGPLLDNGDSGRFIYTSAPEQRWGYRDGAVYLAGSVQLQVADPLNPLRPQAIAVLTGASTRSSGEAMTLAFRGFPRTRSFGLPTSGVPTCNRLHRLDENAAIALTVGWMADRDGQKFDGPIPPDEISEDALGAATSWLRSTAAP